MASISQESLEDCFRDLIESSLNNQDIILSTDAEDHVVKVVCDFATEADVVYSGVYLNGLLREALGSEGPARREYLRITGDIALFITGLFPDSINRRKNYFRLGDYIDIGRTAYCSMETSMFNELSFKFPEVVDVLNLVSIEINLSKKELKRYIERRVQIDARITRR